MFCIIATPSNPVHAKPTNLFNSNEHMWQELNTLCLLDYFGEKYFNIHSDECPSLSCKDSK